MNKPVILIVDDEHLMLNMLGGLLQEDYKVLVATNGEQALARAGGEQKPDMIMLDVVMPGMDGYEVCEKLKANPDTADIPVMFLTSKIDPQEETRGLALGAVDYVAKPITPSIVMARIERHLTLRRLQYELEVKNTALEAEIARRKEAEQALMAARDQEKAANDAKSSFVAHVSHEIRTPLNCVVGMLQLATDTGDARQQQQYVHRALHSAESMITIINDLLDLSKISAGKLDINKTSVRSKLLLEDAVEMLKVPALEKGLDIRTEISAEVAQTVKVDALRVRQILLNLGYNAIKFTQSGTVTLSVEPALSDGQPVLQFTVTDTGIGISTEQQQDLFKPYTQVEHRKYGGTGLGLAICKNLVELMGGQIGVESQPGTGSRFFFTLPLEAAISAEEAAATLLQDQSRLPNSRVLLVDDNPLNLEATSALLRREGVDVLCANSGVQALSVLDKEAVDAILMDIHMPQMDGFETAQAIRKRRDFTTTPILALTADVLSTDRKQVDDAGMNALISKPLDRHILLAELDKWIRPAIPLTDRPDGVSPPARVGDRFASLTGFDAWQGLARADNDEKQYIKYLGMFRDSIAQNIEALTAATENRDVVAIYKIAHAIKGVVPIVGATAIESALEPVLKDTNNLFSKPDPDVLRQLLKVLKHSHISLTRFFEQGFDNTGEQQALPNH